MVTALPPDDNCQINQNSTSQKAMRLIHCMLHSMTRSHRLIIV